jgi:hypothetical protein
MDEKEYWMDFTDMQGKVFSVEVPAWAKWVAQDQSGEWWFFGHKPKPFKRRFEWDNADTLLVDWVSQRSKPPADWTQELYKVVR